MKILLFAKKRETKEGKKFTSYIGTLEKKDGSEVVASVKFREECGNPKAEDLPAYLIVEKSDANLSPRKYADPETGEEKTAYTLWVSRWKMSEEKYVDHSLDDFE